MATDMSEVVAVISYYNSLVHSKIKPHYFDICHQLKMISANNAKCSATAEKLRVSYVMRLLSITRIVLARHIKHISLILEQLFLLKMTILGLEPSSGAFRTAQHCHKTLTTC